MGGPNPLPYVGGVWTTEKPKGHPRGRAEWRDGEIYNRKKIESRAPVLTNAMENKPQYLKYY